MKFRTARHTDNLKKIIDFYCGILGLEVLGVFHDHDNYDGVFIGITGADWHLEFTVSDKPAQHSPDRDDLLVFYSKDEAELKRVQQRFTTAGIPELKAENPYWEANGITYEDPDGYRIVLAKE